MEDNRKLIFSFQDTDIPEISKVGGKGYSLIKMTTFGLKVPPGFVLTIDYFSSWKEEIKNKIEWEYYLNEQEIEENLTKLKKHCDNLQFTEEQTRVLRESIKSLSEYKLFAVRSSSPEEDLEGASFAGGYETVLGVTTDKLENAIKKAFSSCLDYRVYTYKKEKGK